MFDLSSLPLDKVKSLVGYVTKTKPWDLDAADDVLEILKWAVKQFKSNPLSPIGSSPVDGVDDLTALEALAAGETLSDDAVGFVGGGILTSIAISALVRLAVKLLKDNLG